VCNVDTCPYMRYLACQRHKSGGLCVATPDRRQGRDVSATPLPLRPDHPASRVRGGPCSSVVFGLQGLIWGETTGGTGTLPWRWGPRKRRIIQLWRSSLMSGVDKCLIGLFLHIFFFCVLIDLLKFGGLLERAPCSLMCQHFLRPKRRLVRIVHFSRPSLLRFSSHLAPVASSISLGSPETHGDEPSRNREPTVGEGAH